MSYLSQPHPMLGDMNMSLLRPPLVLIVGSSLYLLFNYYITDSYQSLSSNAVYWQIVLDKYEWGGESDHTGSEVSI